MGGAKKRVPKRRFKEFLNAGEWKERKLSELATMNARIGWQNLRTSEFLDSGDYLLITGTDFDNGRVKYSTCHYVEKKRFDQDTKIQLSTGSILITKDGTLGKVALVEELPKPATLNAGVFNVRVKDDTVLSYKYLYHYLKAPFLMKYVTANATGGTIKHLNQSILVDFPIPITEKPEQDRITKLLDSLESSITLHQRKLDKLQATKKALLQEMFPEEGQNKPKRRFKGFTDAWEQRKLTDIAKTFIGLVTTMTENYRDSGTLLIRNSDIKEGQFIFSEKPIHLDEEFAEKNKTRRLQIGDVVTVHTGEIGTSAVIKEKEAGAIGFATINTRTDKRILNPYFLSTYFNTDKHKCYANSVSTGDGRSNYNIKDFNKLVISIPTLDEQEKISAIINNINTIITLHQRKLDKLKNLKQAYLNEMFV